MGVARRHFQGLTVEALAKFPDEVIAQACDTDIAWLAQGYGFAGRASTTGEVVGPCPGCGGTDRFSLNTKLNVWRCRQGGGDPIGGDPIALVMHCEDVSFRRAVKTLVNGDAVTPRARPAADTATVDNEFREKERRRAYELWREGYPFPDSGAVATYLAGRAIDPALARLPGAHCRQHDDFPFWQPYVDGPVLPGRKGKVKFRVIHRGPAMLWPILACGHFLGLHATWLDPAGPKGKAEIFCPDTGEQLPAKKVRGSKKGGAIVLRDRVKASDEAAAGEGIESALSWLSIHDGFAGSLYSAVDLGNLAGRAARSMAHPTLKQKRRDDRVIALRVPGPEPRLDDDQSLLFSPHPGIERLLLLGDGDSDPIVTRAAMQRALARLESTGIDCMIEWPPAPHDFNSLLMQRRGHGMD